MTAAIGSFLSRLALPLLDRLPPLSSGLDYGCGPGPLLAEILKQAGHGVELFDPFYADHPQHLQNRYDFITCTEVAEHFRRPGIEFERLFGLLKPSGRLGLMTKLVIDADAFAHWHYKNDQTHISFLSRPPAMAGGPLSMRGRVLRPGCDYFFETIPLKEQLSLPKIRLILLCQITYEFVIPAGKRVSITCGRVRTTTARSPSE